MHVRACVCVCVHCGWWVWLIRGFSTPEKPCNAECTHSLEHTGSAEAADGHRVKVTQSDKKQNKNENSELSGRNMLVKIKHDMVHCAFVGKDQQDEAAGTTWPAPRNTTSSREPRPRHRRTKDIVNSPSFYVPQPLFFSFFSLCNSLCFARADSSAAERSRRATQRAASQENGALRTYKHTRAHKNCVCEHCDAESLHLTEAGWGPFASHPVHQSRRSAPPPPHLLCLLATVTHPGLALPWQPPPASLRPPSGPTGWVILENSQS